MNSSQVLLWGLFFIKNPQSHKTAMTSAEFSLSTEFKIEGITETSILRYFSTLNAGDFTATAALFAEDGVMHPPFEPGIVGRNAIAAYLQQEAQDIQAEPHQGISENLPDNYIQIQVTGKAQTSWCGVNVLWLFILNQQGEILETQIKLLASGKELLSLRPPNKEYTLTSEIV